MGAWTAGSFGNDDALDWLGDLYTSSPMEFVVDTLARVANASEATYLEAPESGFALAAAEIVAAAHDQPAPDLPEETREWLEQQSLGFGSDLSALARRAVERVKTHSELSELWMESDSADEWLAMVRDLEKRLEAPV